MYSVYSTPVLYMWFKYISIVSSRSIILGISYSYKVLDCI